VVIPLCGGNIDPAVVGRCIERGLATDGRLVRFIVTVSDRPGGIDRLVHMLASSGARYILKYITISSITSEMKSKK
jgi:threonine dehydratase